MRYRAEKFRSGNRQSFEKNSPAERSRRSRDLPKGTKVGQAPNVAGRSSGTSRTDHPIRALKIDAVLWSLCTRDGGRGNEKR